MEETTEKPVKPTNNNNEGGRGEGEREEDSQEKIVSFDSSMFSLIHFRDIFFLLFRIPTVLGRAMGTEPEICNTKNLSFETILTNGELRAHDPIIL